MKALSPTLLLIFIFAFACKKKASQSEEGQESMGQVKSILATTSMLYDAVINIAGDSLDVEYLMGPGVDPHLYNPTQGDIAKLRKADMIVYNGLSLEGKLEGILSKLSDEKIIVAAGEAISPSRLLESEQYPGSYDPHVWMDVSLWITVVEKITNEIGKMDPDRLAYYNRNTRDFLNQLEDLDTFARNQTSTIPLEKRVLVTSHDAFSYFGRAYDFRVEGIQGLSTLSDFGLKDLARVINLVIEEELKMLFRETSVNDKSIRAVIEGCKGQGWEVGWKTLFSDSMGEFGTFEGTYIGMITSNIETITSGLK